MAVTRLAIADEAVYFQVCHQLIERCAESASGDAACRMAWVCLLSNQSYDHVLDLGDLTRRGEGESQKMSHSMIVRGAQLARIGKFEDAYKILNEAYVLAEGVDLARAWLFLAVVEHHLNHEEQAVRRLAQCTTWMRRYCNTNPKLPANLRSSIPWLVRLELTLLHKEVQTLIGAAKPKSKMGKIP